MNHQHQISQREAQSLNACHQPTMPQEDCLRGWRGSGTAIILVAMKRTGLTTLSWLTLLLLLLALVGATVNGAAGGLATGEVSSGGKTDPVVAPPRTGSAFFAPPTGACSLATAARFIRDDTRALALVDARLYELLAPALDGYLEAAARRRQFGIALLPILELDNRRPEELRAALHGWHAANPQLEGALFVGNIKLPSFFLPRADIHSLRYVSFRKY